MTTVKCEEERDVVLEPFIASFPLIELLKLIKFLLSNNKLYVI